MNKAITKQHDHLTVEEWEAKVEASRQVVQLSGIEVNVELFQSDALLINGIEVSRTDLNTLLELME